eukprot:1766163-Rhodomonas_salina.1
MAASAAGRTAPGPQSSNSAAASVSPSDVWRRTWSKERARGSPRASSSARCTAASASPGGAPSSGTCSRISSTVTRAGTASHAC